MDSGGGDRPVEGKWEGAPDGGNRKKKEGK